MLKPHRRLLTIIKHPRYRYQSTIAAPLANEDEYQKADKDFEESFKANYIPTSFFQKTLLTVGSAAISLLDPTRPEMIACLGETTGVPASRYILNKMKESPEGQRILLEKPRINSKTIDLYQLSKLPEGTLGKLYSDFLIRNNVTPDSRTPVQFVDDMELAYVIQRYRELHDLYHSILGMDTNMLGEVTIKWVEAIQTKLPMCIGGAIFGSVRLKPKHRQLYLQHYLPWAIKTGNNAKFLMNIYYEKRWEQSISSLQEELNIQPLNLEPQNEKPEIPKV